MRARSFLAVAGTVAALSIPAITPASAAGNVPDDRERRRHRRRRG